jgi:tetratricopeptide (TPR) repeat protein
VLASRDPTDIDWQGDLSVIQERIGYVLQARGNLEGALAAYRAGLEIREALASCDPADTEWQGDLSVIRERIGDVLLAQGDVEGALAAYRAGVEIREALVRRDPTDTEWQRDLSIIRKKIESLLWAYSLRSNKSTPTELKSPTANITPHLATSSEALRP